MSDFRVYLRVENRLDLLCKALGSIREFWPVTTVVDNTKNGIVLKNLSPAVMRPPVPLTFTQSHNWFFQDAREQRAEFILWMHADAEALNGGHLKLLEYARQCNREGRKWGLIWTYYDSLAAVNLAMIDDVGGYDTVFPKYCCDCDHTYRMRLAGWETIDSGIHTLHLGSQTIKSDPQLQFTDNIVHAHSMDYYRKKWGGEPGSEIYKTPFNRPDIFPNLKPVGVW